MTEATAAPGARLRIERERRGLSLQKAADEMHLDAWVVEALEADQYDRVGPAVYAKGHLKKYAAMLAIPCDEVVAAYDALHAITANAPAPAPSPAVRVHQAPPLVNNLPKGQIAAGVACFADFRGRAVVEALAAARGRGCLRRRRERASARRSAAGQSVGPGRFGRERRSSSWRRSSRRREVRGAQCVAPGDRNGRVARRRRGAGRRTRNTRRSGAASAAPSAGIGAGHARLRMSFSADSWVDVHDAAGRRVFSGYGRANTVKDLAGEAPLRVYLGYASGVQLEINDHAVAIGRSFVHGDVARFQAGADGVLRANPPGAQAGGVAASGAQPHG